MTLPGNLHPARPFAATLSLWFLAAFLLVDLMFMGAHALHSWSPWLKSGKFSIERDHGFAELFQYLKQLLLALGLLAVSLRTRGWVFAGWAMFFGFLLLDDMFQVHERVGRRFGSELGIPAMFGLRTDDYGEIAYAAILGLGLVVFVTLALRHGDALARRFSADLLCLLVALALFAVLFDTLHTMAYFRAPMLAAPLALLEDGGEMLVLSLITIYAFETLVTRGNPRVAVWTWVRGRLPLNPT
jgi:hypothetical protein